MMDNHCCSVWIRARGLENGVVRLYKIAIFVSEVRPYVIISIGTDLTVRMHGVIGIPQMSQHFSLYLLLSIMSS